MTNRPPCAFSHCVLLGPCNQMAEQSGRAVMFKSGSVKRNEVVSAILVRDGNSQPTGDAKDGAIRQREKIDRSGKPSEGGSVPYKSRRRRLAYRAVPRG